MKTDIKRHFKAVQWTTEHTLTVEQRKKMFEDKLQRAQIAQQRLKQREVLCGGR